MSGNGKPHSSASRGKNKGKGSEPSRQNGRGGHNGRSRGGPTPRPVNRQRDLQARASARKDVVLQKLAQSHEEFAKVRVRLEPQHSSLTEGPKGNDFYEAGDYVAAIDAFKRACALYKTTPKFAMKLLEALLKHNESVQIAQIPLSVTLTRLPADSTKQSISRHLFWQSSHIRLILLLRRVFLERWLCIRSNALASQAQVC